MQNTNLVVFPDLSEHPLYPAECGTLALLFQMDYRIFSLIDFGFQMPPKFKVLVTPQRFEGSVSISDIVKHVEDQEGNELSYIRPIDFTTIILWLQNNNIDISEVNESVLKFCSDLPPNTKIVLWWETVVPEQDVLVIELEDK